MQNFDFFHGIDISGIKDFSFTIPELINWLGITTVFYGYIDMDEVAAREAHLEHIINQENPHGELYFESERINSSIRDNDKTLITIQKEPRIKATYGQS